VRPIGLGDLLRPLWCYLGFANALAAADLRAERERAVEDAVFEVAAALATGVSPAGVEAAATLDAQAVRAAFDRAAARSADVELVLVGPVAAARAHRHEAGDATHHCVLRSPWPGVDPPVPPDVLLTMASDGRPLAVGPATSIADRAPVATALCRVGLAAGVDLAGEHLRDCSSRQRIPASTRWTTGHDGLEIQSSDPLPGVRGRVFVVRSEEHVRRERACREEVLHRLRTEVAGHCSAGADRLRDGPKRWVDLSGGVPRLKDKAIADDATFDGCYRLMTSDERPEAELAAAYLRFHDLAADAARLWGRCPPLGRPAIGPALLLAHEAARRTVRPWRELVAALDGRYAVTHDDGGTWRTPPTTAQQHIMDAVHAPGRGGSGR
jgi:hypothetical protein